MFLRVQMLPAVVVDFLKILLFFCWDVQDPPPRASMNVSRSN